MLRNNYEISAYGNNYNLQNFEGQRLLHSCEILSRSPRFAKRAVANLYDVLRRSFCLQQSVLACGLTDDYVTMLSDS